MALKRLPAFCPKELEFIQRVRAASQQSRLERLVESIDRNVRSVEGLAEAADLYPSPLGSQTLGERERNITTLLARMTKQTSFSIDLVIPTRAAVAHALSVARLNFFRMLGHVIRELPEPDAIRRQMHLESDEFVAECIALRAAEEILRTILCHVEDIPLLRERAAIILLHLWHDLATVDLGAMLPVLTATWRARRRIRVSFGTMLGASELYNLLTEGCDPRFIDFLSRPDCSGEEIAAFHEFLFGLSTEEMQTIGNVNTDILTVSRAVRKGLLTETQVSSICQAGDEAETFYLFFMKRHILATNRAEMGLPGPKKTAEQYVLGHLMLHHWDQINVW